MVGLGLGEVGGIAYYGIKNLIYILKTPSRPI